MDVLVARWVVIAVALGLASGCGEIEMRDAGLAAPDGSPPDGSLPDGGDAPCGHGLEPSRAPGIVQRFELEERVGISHADQVVTFDLRAEVDPASTYVIGPDGEEVAHQILSDCRVAVRTSLDAGESLTYALHRGRRAAAMGDAVEVREHDGHIEIDNGLVGVRVPSEEGFDPDAPLAAIQGIRLRDRTWTAEGPNPLMIRQYRSGAMTAEDHYRPFPATSLAVRFLERGPLVTVVEVEYVGERPALSYGRDELIAAGEGFHRTRMRVEAGQPSIVVVEDTDFDARYHLAIEEGLSPDQARYRGHHASSIENGYVEGGGVYRPVHERAEMDAFVDLPFLAESSNPRMLARWDPWITDSGYYWMLYRRDAASSANVLGLFAGPASWTIGARESGVIVEAPDAGTAHLRVETTRRTRNASLYERVRFAWGIFAGTHEDLHSPTEVQPIGRQMNLHSAFRLDEVHRYGLGSPDPDGGWDGLYLPRESIAAIIEGLRADDEGPHGSGYHARLWSIEPSLRDLFTVWRRPAGAGALVDEIHEGARAFFDALVNGPGIFAHGLGYWHGALAAVRDLALINGLLVLDALEPGALSEDERAQIRADLALYANVVWDDDYAPLFSGHGLNLGTANMPVQMAAARDALALHLSHHPSMAERSVEAGSRSVGRLERVVNEAGAPMGSSNYLGASLEPTVNTLVQVQRAGDADPFATHARPRLVAEALMNMLTPPEPRFGGRRKLFAVGDGSTQATILHGQLGTAFREVDPELSERLMGAWVGSGRPHSSFYGSSVLRIDETLPHRDPALGDADVDGYFSVLRHGWGTPDESAFFFVDGEFYRDHTACDLGMISLYALGAPLSIQFGSLYSPRMNGAWTRSVVVAESRLDGPWDGAVASAAEGCFGIREGQRVVSRDSELGDAVARVTAVFGWDHGQWDRTIWAERSDPSRPVFRIRDSFSGPWADDTRVVTLPLMAAGALETPDGAVTPPMSGRTTPSATPRRALLESVSTFEMHGQWGVDALVLVLSDTPTEYSVGSWEHDWHPGPEVDQFRASHGRAFRESQHLLRLRGAGTFDVVIVPFRAGARPSAVVASRAPEALEIDIDGVIRRLPN